MSYMNYEVESEGQKPHDVAGPILTHQRFVILTWVDSGYIVLYCDYKITFTSIINSP